MHPPHAFMALPRDKRMRCCAQAQQARPRLRPASTTVCLGADLQGFSTTLAYAQGSEHQSEARAFQWRLRVQKSQIFMPQVQHSLVEGRRHTSHRTTSCVRGSQCRPSPSNSSSSMSSPPAACAPQCAALLPLQIMLLNGHTLLHRHSHRQCAASCRALAPLRANAADWARTLTQAFTQARSMRSKACTAVTRRQCIPLILRHSFS